MSRLVHPSSVVGGLILQARIDNGPRLRLLLDSGAQHLALERKAAEKSGHVRGGKELDVVGAGGATRSALMSKAGRVEVGPIVLRDCPMLILDGEIVEGADGLIPLSLFAEFLVRLDLRGKTLELEPLPAEPVQPSEEFVRMREENRLLFVETRLGDKRDGFLLLDTGSAFNVIDKGLASELYQTPTREGEVPMQAAGGATIGRPLACQVSYRFGKRVMALDSVLAVDLDEMSRRNEIDISGVIGYPALADIVMTVNYRDSVVSIETR